MQSHIDTCIMVLPGLRIHTNAKRFLSKEIDNLFCLEIH